MSTSSFYDNLNHSLETSQSEMGYHSWGACSLLTPVSLEFYRTWIAQNYHGEMQYLEKHLPQKENPKLLDARLESALVFSFPYVPHPAPLDSTPSHLRTALYSRGGDYHFWLKQKLEMVAEKLRKLYPSEIFICLTDSSPILERDLAYRAGLGWVGKNTCLIDPQQGSFFLLGEIVTSLQFQKSIELVPDFCGTCTRCLEICPTQAIESPRLLNAQKCISYLTIESRQIPQENLRGGMGDWFFGCDLCQTVCPWNQKAFRQSKNLAAFPLETSLKREPTLGLIEELREILRLSGKKLQKKYESSPLQRAGPFGLRRNAIIVATNLKLKELEPEIVGWISDPKLAPLVEWSLKELSSLKLDA